MRTALHATAACTLLALTACGGGGEAPSPRETPAAVATPSTVVPAIDASELMDWAQRTFPLLFPGTAGNQTAGNFIYRFYGGSGIFLGLDGERIYVQGGLFGNSPVQVGTIGQYACLVRFAQCLAPTITTQPQGVTARIGELATLSVTVDGGPSLNFQWLRDGQPIAGANEATLRLTVSEADRTANFSVRVSNDKGEVTSQNVTLNLPPRVDIAAAVAVATREGCLGCHGVGEAINGPAFADVALKYAGRADAVSTIAGRIRNGSVGAWGSTMRPNLAVSASEAELLAAAIMTLAPPR